MHKFTGRLTRAMVAVGLFFALAGVVGQAFAQSDTMKKDEMMKKEEMKKGDMKTDDKMMKDDMKKGDMKKGEMKKDDGMMEKKQ